MSEEEVNAMNEFLGKVWCGTPFERACANYQSRHDSMEMALKELKDRCSYFFAQTDGTYTPPCIKEFVDIIESALKGKYYAN